MNRLLSSMKLTANALDWQGNPCADGSIKVIDLHYLSCSEANKMYHEVEQLMEKWRKKVKIAELEKKLKDLKKGEEELEEKIKEKIKECK